MITRDKLFVGLRLKDTTRMDGSPVLIVTEITEKGFKYTWAERVEWGSRYGFSDRGEMYENHFYNLEIDGPWQRP